MLECVCPVISPRLPGDIPALARGYLRACPVTSPLFLAKAVSLQSKGRDLARRRAGLADAVQRYVFSGLVKAFSSALRVEIGKNYGFINFLFQYHEFT